MALDIEKLRLTLTETANSAEDHQQIANAAAAAICHFKTAGSIIAAQQIANVATFKAIWGIIDWLWEQSDMGHHSLDQHPAAIAVRNLRYYAELAGIERIPCQP